VNERGHLEIGGCDALALARTCGTPLFVMDLEDFRDRLRRYREAFGAEQVHFASKSLLLSTLMPLLREEGVGVDCASGGELFVALQGGFPANRITLHGNNKSERELAEAVEAGVGRVVVDSFVEIERLGGIARERSKRQRVLVRVTPGVEAHTHDYLKTGVEDSKFGFPIGSVALEAVRAAASDPDLELLGLHAHIGSQIFDLDPFAETARIMVGFLAECREATGLELPEIDLGGGLGIAYLPTEEPPPIEDLGKVVHEAVAAAAEECATAVPRVAVEPGRSVSGPPMITLYEVGTIKDVPGLRRYAAVDGGMSDNIRPMLYQARYTYLSAERPGAEHASEYAVCGKCCETGDVARYDALLPELGVGEILAVAATGAYGYSMASNYNRQPKPAVVGVENGEIRVLARRESYEDLIRLER
jgi:diaminopimelate decarboxylase